MSEVK